VDLGVRDNFNVPKIHSLLHYSSSIRLFGTTDNYNTEQTERLHIDFTKDAYRATNHKDEYYQMTTWIERREKLQRHAAFIKWRQEQHSPTTVPPQRPISRPPQPGVRYLKMTRNPTLRRVSFEDITYNYGALDFQDHLGDFLAHLREPEASGRALRRLGENTLIPFHHVPVFHKIKFTDKDGTIVDSVQIQPEQVDRHGRIIPTRFDTVLVWTGQQPDNPGRRIAQVHVVFQIPTSVISQMFPSLSSCVAQVQVPTHLAYIEWFNPIPTTPDRNHGLYKVSRSLSQGRRRAGIISVDTIVSSIHLFPRLIPGASPPEDLTSFSVLEHCQSFYINPFSDRDIFLLFS